MLQGESRADRFPTLTQSKLHSTSSAHFDSKESTTSNTDSSNRNEASLQRILRTERRALAIRLNVMTSSEESLMLPASATAASAASLKALFVTGC